jgi:hypothetical protein
LGFGWGLITQTHVGGNPAGAKQNHPESVNYFPYYTRCTCKKMIEKYTKEGMHQILVNIFEENENRR